MKQDTVTAYSWMILMRSSMNYLTVKLGFVIGWLMRSYTALQYTMILNFVTNTRTKEKYSKYEQIGGGNNEMNDYEEELVDVEIAIHRVAMLRGIFSDNLPHLSEQIMEDMLTIKTFIEKYCDDRTCHHYKGSE